MTIGELSLLLMKAFELKGGIMYSLVGGSRYAYREMKHLKLITDFRGASGLVTGEFVVHALGNVIEWKETYQ